MSRIKSLLAVSVGFAVALSLSASTAAADLTPEQRVLILKAGAEAAYLGSKDPQRSTMQRTRETIIRTARTCIDLLDKAVAKGVSASHLMKADRRVPGATKIKAGTVAPVSAIQAFCASRGRGHQLVFVGWALEKSHKTLQQIEEQEEFDEADVINLQNEAGDCRAAVDLAVGFKAAGDPDVVVQGTLKVKLSRANAVVCNELTEAANDIRKEFDAAVKAEKEKHLAPFRKVLTEDKMEIFERERMWGGGVYTKGGYELETPKQFRKASVWFVVLTFDGEDGYTWWRLRRYAFSGSKLKRQSERTGRGSDPPTKYYR